MRNSYRPGYPAKGLARLFSLWSDMEDATMKMRKGISMFRNFTSIVALVATFCVLGPATATADDDIFSPKLVFVTSAEFTGNLGGLSGADAICQEAADAAGLDGVFQAWLSDSVDTPSTRWKTLSLGPYFLLDGGVVAASFGDLVDGTINAEINVTEAGGQKESPPYGQGQRQRDTGMVRRTAAARTGRVGIPRHRADEPVAQAGRTRGGRASGGLVGRRRATL